MEISNFTMGKKTERVACTFEQLSYGLSDDSSYNTINHPPILLEETDKIEEKEACTLENYCSFYTFSVVEPVTPEAAANGETNVWSCGSERYGGAECHDVCCEAQNGYCRGGGFLGFGGNATMRGYFTCMRQRGCNGRFSCKGDDGSTKGLQFSKDTQFGDSKELNYDVAPDPSFADNSDRDDLCHQYHQGGEKCGPECCAKQHQWCRDSNANLQGFNLCMVERNCKKEAQLHVSKTEKQLEGCSLPNPAWGNPFDVPCFGEKCEKTCASWWQGGKGCEKGCCALQHSYCRGSNAINGMEGYFKCLRMRGCGDVMTCNTDGSKSDYYSSDNYDFTYHVTPTSTNEDDCGTEKQGGSTCRPECCSRQLTHCKDSNAHLRGFFTCMEDRGCVPEAKLKVHETEEQLKGCELPKNWANPFDITCFGETCTDSCASWKQGGKGCEKECCVLQHSYCRGSNAINGMEGYFKCLRMRGCGDVMTCNTDGSKSDYYSSDNYDFTYNVTPNHAEDKCGTDRQGGSTCVDTCCSEQHQYCRDSNGHLRGYMQCMNERGCDGPAVKHIHGGTTQNESDQCKLIGHSNGNAWGNPFDVPCFGETCTKKCETSWYQGKMACAKQCCKVQHNYCRANTAIGGMESYFKCMTMRGCDTTKSCNVDGSNPDKDFSADDFWFTYKITPNDNADECGTARQGGPACFDDCCLEQYNYCRDNNFHLRGFFQCVDERGCMDYAKTKVHGSTSNAKGQKCDLPKNWANPFDIPCMFDECTKKCTHDYQGGDACDPQCCSLQHKYCRGSNAINGMEGYFTCMRMRGCDKVMTCITDGSKSGYYSSDNYDFTYNVTPNVAADACGTKAQGGSTCEQLCCDAQHAHCQKTNSHLRGYFQCLSERGCYTDGQRRVHGTRTIINKNSTTYATSGAADPSRAMTRDECYKWATDKGVTNVGDNTHNSGPGCVTNSSMTYMRYNPENNPGRPCGTGGENCIVWGEKSTTGNSKDFKCDLPNPDWANPFDVPCFGETCEHKCIESGWQGGPACDQQCCDVQHRYCRNNTKIGGMESYFLCMRMRGCQDVMACNVDGSREKYYIADDHRFNYDIGANDAADQCGAHKQGGLMCYPQCCQTQNKYCIDNTLSLRDFFQCMEDRSCEGYAKVMVHGKKFLTGEKTFLDVMDLANVKNQKKICELPKTWGNPYDVPCDLFKDSCTKTCGGFYQGGGACQTDCCLGQLKYCRGANPTMEGYFKCVRQRGCEGQCHYDPTTNYDIDPNDAADRCGTYKQGGLECKERCCDKQLKYCKKSNDNLRGFLQCTEERGCKSIARDSVHDDIVPDTSREDGEKTIGCDLPDKRWPNPYNVPCDINGTCKEEWQCDAWMQGGNACADKCCASQEAYCRNGIFANSTMEGYFSCMRARGCSRVMSCDYDSSTNYDITPNDTADACGTYRQGSARCRPQCCDKQNRYCQDSNGALRGFYQCMNERGCFEEAKIEVHTKAHTDQQKECNLPGKRIADGNPFDVPCFGESCSYKCGHSWQGKKGCEAKCCKSQHIYCRANNAINGMEGYFACLRMRGCDDVMACRIDGEKDGYYKSDPWDFTYNIDPNDPADLCGTHKQGGAACLDDCCDEQYDYCRDSNFHVRGFFTCMEQRGCKPTALKKVHGDKLLFHCFNGKGGACYDNTSGNVGNYVNYAQNYDGWKQYCSSWSRNGGVFRGGKGSCAEKRPALPDQSIEEQCNVPTKYNGAVLNFNVPCGWDVDCVDCDVNTCQYHCEDHWKQGKMACAKKCCKNQHDYCRGSNAINGMEGYFKCIKMRGCVETKTCRTDGYKSGFSAADNYNFTYNITPNEPSDACGTEKQGGDDCLDECCSEQHRYCRDSNDHLRGYLQCMDERGCRKIANNHTHNDETRQDNGVECNLVGKSNGNAWANPFDVPCVGDTCTHKCETSFYQGKMACAVGCCKAQHTYCRANTAIGGMESYFKCMFMRGCDTTKSCKVDGSHAAKGFGADNYDFTYKITPNDSADECGTGRQGGSDCKPDCCAEQSQHCRDHNETLRGYLQCNDERGCTTEANLKIHGHNTRQDADANCTLIGKSNGTAWANPFDVPCVGDTCTHKCETSFYQGKMACAVGCCKAQHTYCRANTAIGGMESYFKCMFMRGCDATKSCKVDGSHAAKGFSSDNYDFTYKITPNDSADECGTGRQGGSDCKPDCCEEQRQHCLDNNHLRGFMQCMDERGCYSTATKLVHGSSDQSKNCTLPKNFGNAFDVPCFGDTCEYKCETNRYQGGMGCAPKCCRMQHDYCRANTAIGGMASYFKCLAMRGCVNTKTCKVDGSNPYGEICSDEILGSGTPGFSSGTATSVQDAYNKCNSAGATYFSYRENNAGVVKETFVRKLLPPNDYGTGGRANTACAAEGLRLCKASEINGKYISCTPGWVAPDHNNFDKFTLNDKIVNKFPTNGNKDQLCYDKGLKQCAVAETAHLDKKDPNATYCCGEMNTVSKFKIGRYIDSTSGQSCGPAGWRSGKDMSFLTPFNKALPSNSKPTKTECLGAAAKQQVKEQVNRGIIKHTPFVKKTTTGDPDYTINKEECEGKLGEEAIKHGWADKIGLHFSDISTHPGGCQIINYGGIRQVRYNTHKNTKPNRCANYGGCLERAKNLPMRYGTQPEFDKNDNNLPHGCQVYIDPKSTQSNRLGWNNNPTHDPDNEPREKTSTCSSGSCYTSSSYRVCKTPDGGYEVLADPTKRCNERTSTEKLEGTFRKEVGAYCCGTTTTRTGASGEYRCQKQKNDPYCWKHGYGGNAGNVHEIYNYPSDNYDFTYKVTANDATTQCGHSSQGGSGCLNECCVEQEDYCRRSCWTEGLQCYYLCLEERSCESVGKLKVHGKGNTKCDWEPLGFTNPFNVPPPFTHKCRDSWYQGSSMCAAQCCIAQEAHCRKSQISGTMHGYFQCMRERGCENDASCTRTGQGTILNYEVDANVTKTKCGKYMQGSARCEPECCETQHDYCKRSNNALHGYFQCQEERGCLTQGKVKINRNEDQTGSHCDWGKNFHVDPGFSDDNKCDGVYQGGRACRPKCCAKQEAHCRGSNDAMEGYFVCMTERNCFAEASCDYDAGTNYEVTANDAKDECGTRRQGDTECEPQCCDKQHSHCTNVCPSLACYNTCMDERGCKSPALVKMHTDTTQNTSGDCKIGNFGFSNPFSVEPPFDNKCASWRQGGTGCERSCCASQEKHCRTSQLAGTMSGYFGCMRERGCGDEIGCSTTGHGVTLNYEVDSKDSASHCGKWLQGDEACSAACCDTQHTHCQNSNTDFYNRNPGGYMGCMKDRGCTNTHPTNTAATHLHSFIRGTHSMTEPTCGWTKNFNVQPAHNSNEKCGGTDQAGGLCKDSCCTKQAAFCGCGVLDAGCMRDRGCNITNKSITEYYVAASPTEECDTDIASKGMCDIARSHISIPHTSITNVPSGWSSTSSTMPSGNTITTKVIPDGCTLVEEHGTIHGKIVWNYNTGKETQVKAPFRRNAQCTDTNNWCYSSRARKVCKREQVLDPPGWGFVQEGVTWPSQCKRAGAYCGSGAECANHELTTAAGYQCCEPESISGRKVCRKKKKDWAGTYWCPNECAEKFDWFDKKPNGRGCTFSGDCRSNKCNQVTIYNEGTCAVGCCKNSGEMKDWSLSCPHAYASTGQNVYPRCAWGCCRSNGNDAGGKIRKNYCGSGKISKNSNYNSTKSCCGGRKVTKGSRCR